MEVIIGGDDMKLLDETLGRLEQMGWISEYWAATGGRSARRYWVNPCLWEGDTSADRSGAGVNDEVRS